VSGSATVSGVRERTEFGNEGEKTRTSIWVWGWFGLGFALRDWNVGALEPFETLGVKTQQA